MSQTKSNTPKIDRRTAAKIEVTRKDALMLFKAINAPEVNSTARVDILEYVDEVLENAPKSDPATNKALFLKFFPTGWNEASPHTRRNVGDIIQRLRAGHSVEEIHEYFEQSRARICAEIEEKERNAPEPKNWLSPQWRYWKIRQLTHALTGDDTDAYAAAWKEYQTLLRGLVANEDFYHVSFALSLLPHLLVARQDIATLVGQPRSARCKPEYFKSKKGGRR
jgi:hypothetical protein